MSGIRYYLFVPKITASNTGAVRNDGGVPSILSGLDDSKPAPGVIGRIYIATDTKWIYRDNGMAWELLGTNAITLNGIPVGRIQASPSSQITDQIIVTPAESVRDRLYNFIPLIPKGSLTNTFINNINDMVIRGNYMYIAGNDKVIAIDISNPLSPAVVGSINYYGANRLDIQDIYLYVTSHPSCGMACIDISDPSLPSLVWNITIAGSYNYARDVIAMGNYLYVTFVDTSGDYYDYEYLRIYDIGGTNIISTTQLNRTDSLLVQYQPMAIKGDYLYVNTVGYINVYDISNKSSPVYKGHVASTSSPLFMKIQGDYLYIAGLYQQGGYEALIYDITNPANPILKGNFSIGKTFYGMDILGNYMYLTSRGTSDGTIHVVDISNPILPEVKKNFTSTDLLNAGVIGAQGNYVYVVANGTNKVIVFG